MSLHRWRWVAALLFVATVGQLGVAVLFDAVLPQFHGKGFAGRLAAYPALMLAVPAVWAWRRRKTNGATPLPWDGIALVMAPFLVDVTGNTLDLYDRVSWWDDANHFVNWLLLCTGIGLLLLRSRIRPTWALGVTTAGIGAVLAIAWELAEYVTFIRFGTELDTAYRDTLGDEALGTLGGMVAGTLVARRAAQPPSWKSSSSASSDAGTRARASS